MSFIIFIGYLLLNSYEIKCQATGNNKVDSFYCRGDVKVTLDRPTPFLSHKKTAIIFYALPNGNTTEQTMGKRMKPGDDWHFDIQHISAQTKFIRNQLPNKNIVVIYLENQYKSWPTWKQKHIEYKIDIPQLIDSLVGIVKAKRKIIYLNGHSGGGSFIFGYLAGVEQIPTWVKRISFLDSDYGYDSSYYPKIKYWLKKGRHTSLNVFAYNDSVALYNGKPVVSPTGGTWYRSHLLLQHLKNDFSFSASFTDSLQMYTDNSNQIQFFFKKNLNQGIYHTQQVELNGFIHSILCGTKKESKHYRYYDKRAYNDLIE